MADYQVLTLSRAKTWNDYLIELPIEQRDTYFTPEYYRLFEQMGEGEATCFVYKTAQGLALYPFLKNTLNRLGYDLNKEYYDIQGAYGYNGVLSSSYEQTFISRFYDSFTSYCQSADIIAEFTRFHTLINNRIFSENQMRQSFDRKTVYVDLKDSYENIFKNFQTTTRKQIKRTVNKFGLHLELYRDSTIVDVFLKNYHNAMDRVQSVNYLYFNKEYFKSLLDMEYSTCFVAYYQSEPVASIITLHNGIYLQGYLGGAMTEYLHMSPFGFLYNEIIKFGKANEFRYVNFGGGATDSKDDSLLKFKLNFSEQASDFYIGKKVHNEGIYNDIVRQWQKRYPEKTERYKNFILKYRY